MQTKPKRNSVITTRVEAGVLTFTVLGIGELRFDPTKAHRSMRDHAEVHGWFQRIPDAAALSKDVDTGMPAGRQIKYDKMRAVIAHYESGADQWNLRVAAPVERPLDVGLVILAMMRAYPERIATVDNANARIDKMASARSIDRMSAARVWLETREVSAAYAAILAERLASGVGLVEESEEETAE